MRNDCLQINFNRKFLRRSSTCRPLTLLVRAAMRQVVARDAAARDAMVREARPSPCVALPLEGFLREIRLLKLLQLLHGQFWL